MRSSRPQLQVWPRAVQPRLWFSVAISRSAVCSRFSVRGVPICVPAFLASVCLPASNGVARLLAARQAGTARAHLGAHRALLGLRAVLAHSGQSIRSMSAVVDRVLALLREGEAGTLQLVARPRA